MRRTTAMVGLMTLALGLAVAGAPRGSAAEDTPERHPHPLYDDGGTLDWRTRIEDAMEVAGERRRLIFIEWGRET